ncbi:MAG: hypothetical protein AAF125_18595 [Chloroflexota bacterium]
MFRMFIPLSVVLLLLVAVPLDAQLEDVPSDVLAAAFSALSDEIGEALTDDNLMSVDGVSEEFSDASLGCPEEGGFYAQVIVPGYALTLVVDGLAYDVRVSEDTDLVVICGEPISVESSDAAAEEPVADTDITPVLAIFPTTGPARTRVTGIANDLPGDVEISIGLGLEDGEPRVVETLQTTEDGSVRFTVNIPNNADTGDRFVVVLTTDDGAVLYTSDVFIVGEA